MDDIFVLGTKQQPRGRDDKADRENYKKKASKEKKRKQNHKMMENRKKIDGSRDKVSNQHKSRLTDKNRREKKKKK